MLQATRFLACFDGTFYQIVNPANQVGGYGPLTNVASAATVDLGAVPSHSINITGTTTVTSFGSSATTTYSVYHIRFGGVMTLTQNGASFSLPGQANITTAVGDHCYALYLGGGVWEIFNYSKFSGIPVIPTPVRGLIGGLVLSGGGSQTLTIATGAATSDDVSVYMSLGAFTKTFANWAVGSGNGGLDTGSIATNTWYHVYVIQRPDTGVVDVLISLSATAPTFPTNYTKKRRIGSVKTDATPNIIPFFAQPDGTFLWGTMPALDQNTANPGTAAITVTTAVPTGVEVEGIYNTAFSFTNQAQNGFLLSSLDVADTAPATAASPLLTGGSWSTTTNGAEGNAQARIWTNTSAQIRSRTVTSDASVTARIQTIGWRDLRGQWD